MKNQDNEIIELAKKHGASGYSFSPTFGFTPEGLIAFVKQCLASEVQGAVGAPVAAPNLDDGIKQAIDAMELALSSRGKFLMSNPPQDMWVVGGVSMKLRNAIAALAGVSAPAMAVPSEGFKLSVYSALGCGSEAAEFAAVTCIQNLIRRESCLSAVERQFFMVATPPDEDEGETEPGEECLLNWGQDPEQYAAQFEEALKRIAPQAQADARDAGKLHFWVADDPDTAHESLHEAVMEAFETNGVQPGGFVEIQREISLPNILVRITSTKPFAFEEVPDAAIAAQAAKGD